MTGPALMLLCYKIVSFESSLPRASFSCLQMHDTATSLQLSNVCVIPYVHHILHPIK
jgi:hypothetical protein